MKIRRRYLILLIILAGIGLLFGYMKYSGASPPGRKSARNLVHSPGNVSYYVDNARGDDQQDGTTPDRAWKTLGRVNEILFAPGDRILFKAGSVFSGQLAPWGSGKEGASIVIDRYGTGEMPRVNAEGRFHEAVLLENQEYWEVTNLELTNQGKSRQGYRYGVRVAAWDFGSMRHIQLKHLFVHDVNGSVRKGRSEGHGILWENGGKITRSRFEGLLIEQCHLLRTDRNGICGSSAHSERNDWFPNLNVVIRNNLLEDIGGDGIKPFGCDGVLVERNRLDGANRRAPDYSAGMWPWSCDNSIFQSNEVSGVKGTRDGQAFDSDGNCQGTIFQYNYSHDNEGGFLMICDDGGWKEPYSVGNRKTIVRYNISQNDAARTFHFTGPIKDALIYNNTIFIGPNMDLPLFLFTDYRGWADEVYVANNIFYVAGKAHYSHGTWKHLDGSYVVAPGFAQSRNIKFENNLFFGHHDDPPSDPNPRTADPLLVGAGSGASGFNSLGGYKLKVGSPCVGTGVLIPDNGDRDLWGGRLTPGKNPSIGAYEWE